MFFVGGLTTMVFAEAATSSAAAAVSLRAGESVAVDLSNATFSPFTAAPGSYVRPGQPVQALYWYGSAERVANKMAYGFDYGGPGAGWNYWATADANAGTLSYSTGGSVFKGSLTGSVSLNADMADYYMLWADEAALFKPATGFDYSWDVSSWLKGAGGQFYYRPDNLWLQARAYQVGGIAFKGATLGGALGGIGWSWYTIYRSHQGMMEMANPMPTRKPAPATQPTQ